jgi:hypothetical protein
MWPEGKNQIDRQSQGCDHNANAPQAHQREPFALVLRARGQRAFAPYAIAHRTLNPPFCLHARRAAGATHKPDIVAEMSHAAPVRRLGRSASTAPAAASQAPIADDPAVGALTRRNKSLRTITILSVNRRSDNPKQSE